jgi:ribonuclease BN (tRNA processing enzyme)
MFATLDRAASGYLVEYDDNHIWMDAGAGTWRNLLHFVDYRDVTGVVLSHRHPDHTTDVFQLFHARHYGDPDPMSPIPLWAPQETLDRLLGYSTDLHDTFDMRAVAETEAVDVGPARFTFVRMAHPPVTLGVRVEHADSVLAYSSDSGPDADFTALAQDADVFVCEATFQDSDEEWEGHMRASQAGTIAAQQGVKRLVLTHLPPGRDLALSLAEAKATCGDVPAELADDYLRVERF